MAETMDVGDTHEINDRTATVIETHRDDDRHDVDHVAEVDGDICDQLVIDVRDDDHFGDDDARYSPAKLPCAWSELTDMHRVIEESRDTVKHSTGRRSIEHIVETVQDETSIELSAYARDGAIATLEAWESTGRL